MFGNKELYMPIVPSSLKGKTFENKLIEKNLLKYENNLELINQIKKVTAITKKGHGSELLVGKIKED